MRKRLVRAANDCFVSCQTRNCPFGFVVECNANGKPPKPQNHTCPLCQKSQLVEKGKEGELDDAFKQMINEGKIKPCPKVHAKCTATAEAGTSRVRLRVDKQLTFLFFACCLCVSASI
jgi:hypothetical protein